MSGFFVFFLSLFLSTLSTISTYKRLKGFGILALFAKQKKCAIVHIQPKLRVAEFAESFGNVFGRHVSFMSQFKLQQDVFTQATRIPNCFIEKYMPKAAGEFVKIYIYLLKCVEENRSELSIAKIADALEDSEKDVIRALKYWEKKGLLKLTFEEGILTSLRMISFSEMTDEAEKITVNVSAKAGQTKESSKDTAKETLPLKEELPAAETMQPETAGPSAITYTKQQYTPAEIAAFSQQDDITMLLYSIQKYLGRALTGSDLNTVLFFHDTLDLPVDVIEYLFEYCISNGHKHMRYIEKTAIGWSEQGIRSLKAAKTLNGIYSDNCYPVLRAFGLTGRKPSKGEAEYVSKWTLSYGFNMEMILEACNRTMNSIHQPSFEYTDSILKRWKAAGISSMEEVKALDEKREMSLSEAEKTAGSKKTAKKAGAASNKFNNFDQRTYDYSELEEKLFNT